jgi:glutaconate CoA-transferase, subunit A
MAELVGLREAVAGLVSDGDSVALEGFTHLIPFAAAHEIIRQEKRNLTLVRMTPDLVCDQMIGMGTASKLIFSWGGNPGVGSLHRFRDAVEHGWPAPLEIEEHSHAGMANRYVAGASNLPFAVLRGYVGTDLPEVTPTIKPVECPSTGERLAAVPALKPDVAVIHAQQADRQGNVAIWGITGIQKEAALSARRVIVTVEEVVEAFEPRPFQIVLPSVAVDAVSRRTSRRAPLLRRRLLRPRQRLLRGVGPDRTRPGALPGVDGTARPRPRRLLRAPQEHRGGDGMTQIGRDNYATDEIDDGRGFARA